MAESGVEELRRRVGRDPGSRLFAQLAEEQRKAGDLSEAIRIARGGSAAHPSSAAALLTLGRALTDSGDGEGARTALEETVSQAPDNIVGRRFLGQALAALGDLERAVGQYRATLKMAPEDRQAQERLRALERRAASAPTAQTAAGAAADEVRERAGATGTPGGDSPPFSSSTLAELYLRQGFAERAIDVYRQVVLERPGDEKARTRLSELASQLALARSMAGGAQEVRRRALQRAIAGLEVLLGVARRR